MSPPIWACVSRNICGFEAGSGCWLRFVAFQEHRFTCGHRLSAFICVHLWLIALPEAKPARPVRRPVRAGGNTDTHGCAQIYTDVTVRLVQHGS